MEDTESAEEENYLSVKFRVLRAKSLEAVPFVTRPLEFVYTFARAAVSLHAPFSAFVSTM